MILRFFMYIEYRLELFESIELYSISINSISSGINSLTR